MPIKKFISILVSTYNSKNVKYVLDALEKQTYRNFEVIVCDDGSKDFKKATKKKRPYMIKYIWHPDIGRTWSWNHNEGLKLANGEYILLLHDDIIPRNDLLENLLKYLNHNSIITGIRDSIPNKKKAIRNPEKYVLFKDHRLDINEELFSKFKINIEYENQAIDLTMGNINNPYEVVSGCIMAFPKKEILEIGGFAEDLPGWGLEDYDVSLRFYNKGFKILMPLNVKGYHIHHDELNGKKVKDNRKELDKRILTKGYINNFNHIYDKLYKE